MIADRAPTMPPSDLPPLRDHIRRDVRVLFVGINPGVRSAMTGHHFAGPSNRFWTLLHEAGLVPEPVGYEDDARLPQWGYGITNIVSRPTAGVEALRRDEFVDGRGRLLRKVNRYRPAIVALVGITVFRACFPERTGRVLPGPQPERLGPSTVFVLPNPSGRNAGYSYDAMLAAFRTLDTAVRRLARKP
jgi:TDG/mug DNA glycosylase family protein